MPGEMPGDLIPISIMPESPKDHGPLRNWRVHHPAMFEVRTVPATAVTFWYGFLFLWWYRDLSGVFPPGTWEGGIHVNGLERFY